MENSTKINMPTLKADDIIEKAAVIRAQELDTLINNMADSLSKASSGKNLSKYWKTQDELIKDVITSYKTFNKESNKNNATELIKTTNALKAIAGVDLSNILPDFDEFTKSFNNAKKKVGNLDSAFNVKGFKEVFDVFNTLEQQGLDVQEVFSHFGVSSDISKLQQNVRSLEEEVENLTKRLLSADDAKDVLQKELDDIKIGSGFADKLDELDRLKAEMQNIRNEAILTFNQFLEANKIDKYDWFNNDRFAEYFEKLENGKLTASDAIRQFKTEYDYLLEESFKSNGNSFGLDQLQAFSTKLDSIFQQVEETSNKINDILSNGVIAKSVQNLSEDTTLSDSQRSIFGNILQDEESLKSITALFQKLIDETNQTKNTDIFNTEQFTKIESLFTSIESSLSSIKGVLVDVGDGEELSPLLKTIANIESAIDNLSSSVKGIGLNMNIDFGSDSEMEAKAQAKISNALQAYQNLFEHIKMSSAGGSLITQKFFDFDINQFDTPMSKLQAYIKFIKDMREETKKMFGGQDILKIDTDDKYWNRASAAMGQVRKTFNEMKAASDANPLENIFGKTDLTEVISQLENIVSKLDEISVSAKEFTETFKNGLNVNASVEEIEKLTNRVKELEDELARVKAPTIATTPQESDISSDISSQVKVSDNITDQIIKNEKKKQDAYKATTEMVMYHAGIISKLNKAETNGQFYGSDRNTGYFGTGHYFVDANTKHELDDNDYYSSLPYTSIDISKYDNLFKATTDEIANALHTFLKNLTQFTQGSDLFDISELFSQFQKVFGESTMDMQEFDEKLSYLKTYMQNSDMFDRGDSVSTQFMKSLGYGGVDTRGTNYADTRYGTVIYDLKEESILQSNITDELQKQGQMLDKINYEKGQVFDKSEDAKIQNILDQQAKSKEIEAEFNKIFDSTNLNTYENELESVNQKLSENKNIIDNCNSAIKLAEEDAREYARDMAEIGKPIPDEKLNEIVKNNKVEYQERIEELSKEQSLLKDRKQEIESNLDAEYKLANAARERATATVEDRMKDAFPKTSENLEQVAKSEQKVQQEAVATDKALDNISFTPNTEGFDNIIAKFGILREQAEQITKIVKTTKQTADGTPDISYKATLRNGSSYYLGENSIPQVLTASETVYDTNAIKKAYQEATKVNNALNETNSLLNSLKIPNGFEGSFSTLESEVKRLNNEFTSGKISASEYTNSIKKAFSNYQTPIDNKSKDIWNDLTTSLDRYATLQKRIASNNALSTDNEEATKLLEHIHELQKNDILPTERLTASNEKLQQINQTVTDLKAKLKESTLDSLQGSIDKYQKIYDQRSTYSSDFTPSEQYTKNLTELNTAIKNLVEYKNVLKNVSEVTVEQETYLKGLVTACEKASDSFKSLSASEKGASQIGIDKLVQRINKDLDENTNYSKRAKLGLRALRDELESANPRNLKKITSEIINIENAEIRAGRAGRSFFDTLKNSRFHQIAAQMAGMFSVYDVINVVKEGINTVRELDAAMTEVRKVSNATEGQYKSFRNTISSTAKEIATTNKELLNSSADFLRLGYSLDQASDLAKNATLFVNVGDGVDITEATEDMITAMKAFDIQAKDSIKIVDDYNQIGKYILPKHIVIYGDFLILESSYNG
nr:MAG TPA: minor tail protein [Caudoviricetes sp.]